MKKFRIQSTIFALLLFISFSNKLSFALDTEDLKPTQPPRIPVTDYDTGSHRVLDFMYMHYSFEDFDLDGGGIGFNYISNIDRLAYNLGAGITYLEGSASDIDLDIYAPSIPLNGNIGIRILGDPQSHNLMIFGGLHWTYMVMAMTLGDYDITLHGPAYGPMAGAKGEIKMTPSVSLIPYYIFQHTMYDMTVDYEGVEEDVDIDPVTTHLFGFDVKFSGFSVGALLDAMNNADNDRIMILFSYDFDYEDKTADMKDEEAEEDKKPVRRRR